MNFAFFYPTHYSTVASFHDWLLFLKFFWNHQLCLSCGNMRNLKVPEREENGVRQAITSCSRIITFIEKVEPVYICLTLKKHRNSYIKLNANSSQTTVLARWYIVYGFLSFSIKMPHDISLFKNTTTRSYDYLKHDNSSLEMIIDFSIPHSARTHICLTILTLKLHKIQFFPEDRI